MKTLKEYLRKECGYVSCWWKYIFLIWLWLDIAFLAILAATYDFRGDVGEYYFSLNDKLLMIGVIDVE